MPFALTSDHPPTFFPLRDFELATQLSLATRLSQGHFLRLTPYYPSTMWASRFVTIIPSRWRPLSTAWSTGVCRPLRLPLSRGCGPLFPTYWLSRSTRAWASLENAKPVWWPLPLPRLAEAISGEVGKAHDAYGGGCVHGEEPEPGLCRPACPGLCPHGTRLWLPGKPLPGEAGEAPQDGDHLINLRGPAGPQAGLGEYRFGRLTLKSPKHSGLWGPPLVSGLLPEAPLCSHKAAF